MNFCENFVNNVDHIIRVDTKFCDTKFREISHQEFISYFAKFLVYFAKFRDRLSRNKNGNCLRNFAKLKNAKFRELSYREISYPP